MNMILQWLVVGLLLAWSCGAMLARVFPGTAAGLRGRLAAIAEQRGYAGLATRLRAVPAAGGCDSGCSSCKSGCGTPVAAALPHPSAERPAPVRWRP